MIETALTVLSVVTFGVLARVAAKASVKSITAKYLSYTCVLLAFYSAFDLMDQVSEKHSDPNAIWERGEYACATWAGAACMWFAFSFIGERQRTKTLLRTFTAVIVLLGCAVFMGISESIWALSYGALLLPMLLILMIRTADYYRRVSGDERMRTHLMISSLMFGAGGAVLEMMWLYKWGEAHIIAVSLFLCTLMLTFLTIRFSWFEKYDRMFAFNLGIAAALALGLEWALFVLSENKSWIFITGSVLIVFLVWLMIKPLMQTQKTKKMREEQLATLGRFSAQMAHDMRNPLAAIKGAAQYLEGELSGNKSIADYKEFIALIAHQADKMTQVSDAYKRIGAVEPLRESIKILERLQGIAKAQQHPGIQITVDGGETEASVDPLMFDIAIENLIRNAREAFPSNQREKQISLSVRRDENRIIVSVSDNGPGMSARVREMAFEDFFTTKTTGSGLGLPYVSRVAQAHGGYLSIDSKEGEPGTGSGTTVCWNLPN